MRVKLQLVMCSDDGREETVTDLVTLQKDSQRIEHLGLTLKEAKQLLTTIQKRLLHHQVDAFLDGCSTCPDCGTPLKVKGYHTRTFRTLFGTFKLVQSTSLPLPLPASQDDLVPPAVRSPPGVGRPPSCSSWRRSGPLWSRMV